MEQDQRQEELNLELEDIIREFSEKPVEEKLSPSGPMEDTIPLENIASVHEEPGEAPAEPEEMQTFTPEDLEDTKAFSPEELESTQPFAPVENKAEPQLAEDTIVMPALKEEEPAKEPQEPKIIRMRTPLQQMRRKIVEGPERQYYALREKGIAKLQLLLVLSLLVAAVSACLTALHALGLIGAERLRLVIFSQVLLMLLSALMGAFQIVDGILSVARLRFTSQTLLAITFIACCLDSVSCLFSLRVPCTAAFCMQVFMSLWGACMQRKVETDRMDTMRQAKVLAGITASEDYFDGAKGLIRGTGDVDDFMDTYEAESTPEKVLRFYSLGAFVASLGIGVTGGVLFDSAFGIQCFLMAVLASMPGTIFITLQRPRQLLERRLYQVGSVLCGWQGIKGLCGKAVFPLTHEDIFPEGTVKLNGIKFYGEKDPKTVVGYAAAVARKEGGSLAPLLEELRDSHNAPVYETDNFKFYSGGIGGGVEGQVVLMGTLPFLRSLDISIPEDVRMGGALGVAVDGEFSCLLAVNFTRKREVAAGLSVLSSYRKLTPILVSHDLSLSGRFLQNKFGIHPKKIRRPEPEERDRMRAIVPSEGEKSLALLTRPSLVAYGYTLAGARSLHQASILGTVVHMMGGIIGLIMMLVLTILGAEYLLTPWNILLYHLVWMIPGMLLTEWTRAI